MRVKGCNPPSDTNKCSIRPDAALVNAEFGSERGLFDAALVQYNATSLTAVLADTESSRAGIDAVRSTFAGFAAAADE